jgi:hypothetical protein
MPTTIAPPTPDVLALASAFDVIAKTAVFGIDHLFARWQGLRVGSARHPVDVLQGVSFAAVIDAILDYRSNPALGFSILATCAAIQL